MSEQARFLNRLKSLFNIDADQVPELTREQWYAFRDDPVRFLLRASDAQAASIWREVEKRQPADTNSLQAQLDAANEGAWAYEDKMNAALKSLQEIADMRVGDQPAAMSHYSEENWVRRHVGIMRHLAGTAVKTIVADEAAKPKPVETVYEIISGGLSDGTCAANIIDRLIDAGHLRAGAQ